MIIIPRYYCDYCGNPVTRYGKPAKKAKRHFCNRDCFVNWMKKNGPINKRHWEYNKNPTCIICHKKFRAKTLSSKYCPLCKQIVNNLQSYQKRHNIKDPEPYLHYLIEKGRKVDIAKEILKRRKLKVPVTLY